MSDSDSCASYVDYVRRGRDASLERRRLRNTKASSDETESEFALWLRDQLAARNWRDRELAERTGVSTAAVSRWIGGSRTPSSNNVTRLANALSIQDEEIYTRLVGEHRPIVAFPRPAVNSRPSVASFTAVSVDEFPNWLHHELVRQNLTAEELSRQVGVEATVVRFWLKGLLSPSPLQTRHLEAVLYQSTRVRRLA